MSAHTGRWSPAIVAARNRARFARVMRPGCACTGNPLDGPCRQCEGDIDDAASHRDAPDPDLEDQAMQRIERSYERWLEASG